MDASEIIVAVVAGIPAIAAAAFAWKSSAQANRVGEKKVDAEAYERSRGIYEKTLDDADKQLDRLRQQQERMSEQLAQEREVSSKLREQVRTLEAQMRAMDETVATLRAQLEAATGGP